MDYVSLFLGRFHPVLVHLPIGILILAFVFEVLACWKPYAYLKSAVRPSLFIGAVSAIVACVTGYFLSQEGGYAEKLLSLHQYLGIATAFLASLLFILRSVRLSKYFHRGYLGVVLFAPVIAALSITGHLGGSLTHGEEFLSFDLTDSAEFSTAFKPIANIDHAVVYSDVIQPILKSKCYSCHSSKKQKGDLRLDEIQFIKRGGEHGEIIVSGLPDSSVLYKALMLPLEDEEHMPPKGKPQLTSTEIAILQNWIEEGASFEKRVEDFAKPEKMKTYIASLQVAQDQHWVPDEEVREPDAQAVASLRSKGILVMPVSQDRNYVMINFINKRTVTDEDLEMILKLKGQLLWLNLAGTTIADSQLMKIAALNQLRWIHLNNSTISDEGIKGLLPLDNLMFINLVNTRLTNIALDDLLKLKKLKKIFVYRTKISAEAITAFLKQKPGVTIDTGGYLLPQLASDSIIFKRKI